MISDGHGVMTRWRSLLASWPVRIGSLVVLAVVVLLIARPAGSWIGDRLRERRSAQAAEDLERQAEAPFLTDDVLRRITFVPAGDTITLVITARQRRGTLTIAFDRRITGVVEASGDATADDFATSGSEIRLENEAAWRADYRLTVPNSVTAVLIRIGTESPQSFPYAEYDPAMPMVVDLGSRRE
jgi:hypothetical protein